MALLLSEAGCRSEARSFGKTSFTQRIGSRTPLPQQYLNFFALPHGHCPFRPTFAIDSGSPFPLPTCPEGVNYARAELHHEDVLSP